MTSYSVAVTQAPIGAAGGDLVGSFYPAPVIAPSVVTSAKILDGTIVNADIAAAAAIAVTKLANVVNDNAAQAVAGQKDFTDAAGVRINTQSSILSGAGVPGALVGINGDIYIDSTLAGGPGTAIYYKTGGVWGAIA